MRGGNLHRMDPSTKLYDIEVPSHLAEALDVDEMDIKTEFARLPGDLAYWNSRHADAVRLALDLDLDRKVLIAELTNEYRERLEVAAAEEVAAGGKGKRPTEAMIESAVRTDARYLDVSRRLNAAQADEIRMRGFAAAISAKKSMLLSLGSHVREEIRDPELRELRTYQPGADGF